jgi:mRNA-degrading endonuclease RelE of RelBE toxin-antitoxin system
VRYEIRLSHRAERDLDRLDKPTQKRMMRRLEQLAEDPYDPRISAPLSGAGNLRKSRVGAWRKSRIGREAPLRQRSETLAAIKHRSI